MKVKVVFFAALREQLGTSAEELELPAGVGTVGALKNYLMERGGAYGKAFGGKALIRIAVNQDMAQPTARIKAGDEIAFFPPVTGG